MLQEIDQDFQKLKNPDQAAVLQRFFKTGPGEYAEGDIFLGLKVPQTRTLVKKYNNLSLAEITELIKSPIHEKRLLALLLMVEYKKQADEKLAGQLYNLYLKNTRFINNWDLVDLSAEHIVGGYLKNKDRTPLLKLAKSKLLWERRIAILATFNFIKTGDPVWTLRIAELLLADEHDLIHKAVGWMLREVGKRCSRQAEEDFLKKYYKKMPRTMLRYAIERFPEKLRLKYLKESLL